MVGTPVLLTIPQDAGTQGRRVTARALFPQGVSMIRVRRCTAGAETYHVDSQVVGVFLRVLKQRMGAQQSAPHYFRSGEHMFSGTLPHRRRAVPPQESDSTRRGSGSIRRRGRPGTWRGRSETLRVTEMPREAGTWGQATTPLPNRPLCLSRWALLPGRVFSLLGSTTWTGTYGGGAKALLYQVGGKERWGRAGVMASTLLD